MTLHENLQCNCGCSFIDDASYRTHVTEYQVRYQIALDELVLCMNHSECSEGIEVCVYCFAPFQNPNQFISHARTSHREAADPTKAAYMEAICERLESQSGIFEQQSIQQSQSLQDMQLSLPGDMLSAFTYDPLPEFFSQDEQQWVQTIKSPALPPTAFSTPMLDLADPNGNEQEILSSSFTFLPTSTPGVCPEESLMDLSSFESMGSRSLGGDVAFKPLPSSGTQPAILSQRQTPNGIIFEEDGFDSPLPESSEQQASETALVAQPPSEQLETSVGNLQITSRVIQSYLLKYNAAGDVSLSGSSQPSAKGNRSKRCVRCKAKRRVCTVPNDGACGWCSRMLLPHLCVKVSLSDFRIFDKWDNSSYALRLRWAGIEQQVTPSCQTIDLSLFHLALGPSFPVRGVYFEATDPEQTRLWGKTKLGWSFLETASICLEEQLAYQQMDMQLTTYILGCRDWCVKAEDDELLETLYSCAIMQGGHLLDAFTLWTANRLLMKGWQCTTSPWVMDASSPYHSSRPAPRVLQNQLDQRLEQFIARFESIFLQQIHEAINKRSGHQDYLLTAILLLKVVEQDIWRLMYWVRHKAQAYKWRHPLSPQHLIEKGVFFSKVLLAHTLDDKTRWPEILNSHFLHLKNAPELHYDEGDDQSLSGSLVRYAFKMSSDLSEAAIIQMAEPRKDQDERS